MQLHDPVVGGFLDYLENHSAACVLCAIGSHQTALWLATTSWFWYGS